MRSVQTGAFREGVRPLLLEEGFAGWEEVHFLPEFYEPVLIRLGSPLQPREGSPGPLPWVRDPCS